MEPLIEKYRGIHPGLILERELNKRNIKKGPFAISIHEYPQIINEVTKGRRGIPVALSLKIDRALDFEEGTMFILQAYYELKRAKDKIKQSTTPELSVFRKILFWDTDMNKIDWQKHYKAVIQRVFERGNADEKKETVRFYGEQKIKSVLKTDDFFNTKIPVLGDRTIK